jgi:hypothetical protein
MKGYKAFNKDLTCLGYQFTTNKTHTFDGEPVLCVKGFHFCTDLQDVVKYYHQPDMRVFEIEVSGIITEAEEDCSKRACSEIKLIKELSLYEVAHSITKSELAYLWARDIGNRDIMISRITNSEYAYRWARWIGNIDIMIDRITESGYACEWALYIGNQDIMKSRITRPYWIQKWNNWFLDYQII